MSAARADAAARADDVTRMGAAARTDTAARMDAAGASRGKVRFCNAVIHTMESETDYHRAMTVEGGVITGFDECGLDDDSIDLGGMHVFPALIDSHLHMLDTIALSAISQPVCTIGGDGVEPHDLAGIGRRIEAQAAASKGDAPILATNYITSCIAEGRLPNRDELDAWSGGREAERRVWVMSIDGHSGSCSTAMLDAIGLTQQAPDGILTGPLHDSNLGKLTDVISSSITPALLGDGIADFCDTCASYGIGTVCALDGTDDSIRDRLTEVIAFLAQRFPLDVRLFPQYMDETKLARVVKRMRVPRVGGCMKWELDGSVGSRTAAFVRPFLDGNQGHLYFDTKYLTDKVNSLASRGFQVSAHAIGELAIAQLIGIYEGLGEDDSASEAAAVPATSAASTPAPSTPAPATSAASTPAPCRHRIDHCEFPAPADIPRLIALRPYVTVQPGYAWIDKRYLHGYERWLDADRIAQQVPLADLAAHGVTLLGSSDSPVQSVDPYLQMRGMREFYVENQSLSAYEALKTYTVNGGEALGEKKGLLRAGYEASFLTIASDLLDIPPSGLDGLQADALYIRGRRYPSMPHGGRALVHLLAQPARKI